MSRWMNDKVEWRLLGEISTISDMQSEKKLKSLLIRVKEESEKADLKINIIKTKIMTSSPITS